MKLFKKTLAMVLAMAMLSSAAVFPAFATEEDPADVPGVEDVVEEPIAEEPVVEEPNVESPAGQGGTTWDFGASTFSVSGTKTVKVGETITLTCNETGRWHTHSWGSYQGLWGNTGKVEIVSGSNSSTVTIRGVTEGQVYVYCDQRNNRIQITVEAAAVAEGPSLNDKTVYFYLLKPGEVDKGNGDLSIWAPFGIGELDYETARESSVADQTIVVSAPNVDALIKDTPLPYFPASGTGYGGTNGMYAQSLTEKVYPVFTRSGSTSTTKYKWEYDNSPDHQDIQNTYSIRWDRVKKCNGANCGDYDNWVNNSVYTATWHVDGTVIFPDMITVSYKVQDPNTNEFKIVENVPGTDFTYTVDPQGTTVGSINVWPTFSNKGLSYDDGFIDDNGVEWAFDGWYMDAACTIAVASVSTDALKNYATNGQVFFYAKYAPILKTVTFVYLSDTETVSDKMYYCRANDMVPLPYGPEAQAEGKYFAGWSYRDKESGDVLTSRGNDGTVAWIADEDDPNNMTITASYYTNVLESYTAASGDLVKPVLPTYGIVKDGDYEAENQGRINTPLFGTPSIVQKDGTTYLLVKFNASFEGITLKDDDAYDLDTGIVIAENYDYNTVGFVVSTEDYLTSEEENLVANAPTVQGGYDYTESNDVFINRVNGIELGNGYYIVIKLDGSVDYATPYAIDAFGNYHYGTPWARN